MARVCWTSSDCAAIGDWSRALDDEPLSKASEAAMKLEFSSRLIAILGLCATTLEVRLSSGKNWPKSSRTPPQDDKKLDTTGLSYRHQVAVKYRIECKELIHSALERLKEEEMK